ncbi:Cabeza CG3606PBlike, partial [Caligus rogercresseyi]
MANYGYGGAGPSAPPPTEGVILRVCQVGVTLIGEAMGEVLPLAVVASMALLQEEEEGAMAPVDTDPAEEAEAMVLEMRAMSLATGVVDMATVMVAAAALAVVVAVEVAHHHPAEAMEASAAAVECPKATDPKIKSSLRTKFSFLDDIAQFFGSIGVIKNDKRTGKQKIWIYKDQNGDQKGEATVTYDDPSAAQSAISWFDGKEFNNKPIKVQMAMIKAPPPGGYGIRGGPRGRGGFSREEADSAAAVVTAADSVDPVEMDHKAVADNKLTSLLALVIGLAPTRRAETQTLLGETSATSVAVRNQRVPVDLLAAVALEAVVTDAVVVDLVVADLEVTDAVVVVSAWAAAVVVPCVAPIEGVPVDPDTNPTNITTLLLFLSFTSPLIRSR